MGSATILSLGAALVDTEVKVGDADLQQLGLEKGLMSLSDARAQQKNIDHLREHIGDFSRASGGSAANSMIAIARLGGSAHLTCQVADDENGAFFLQDLQQCGVRFNQRGQSRAGTTGTCLVLITPDAERTMNTCLAISDQLSIQNLEEEPFGEAGWLYLEGYLATSDSGRQAAVQYAQQARQQQIPVALSLSDPGIVQHFYSQLAEMAEGGIQLLFGNLAEALTWTGSSGLTDACRELDTKFPEYAITLGAEGALVAREGQRWQIPAPRVNAVDTNGAGDAFAGIYLHARNQGLQPPAAASLACFAAAQVVTQMGPRLTSDQAEKVATEMEKTKGVATRQWDAYRL